MKVILQDDVSSLGAIGDVVNVKAGFARNFLFPKMLAVVADSVSLKRVDMVKKQLKKKKEKLVELTKALASKLEKVSITINKQVGEEDRIFGSVTTTEIEALLKDEGYEINKRDIEIEEEVKKIGVYHANITLDHGVTAKLKFWVVAK